MKLFFTIWKTSIYSIKAKRVTGLLFVLLFSITPHFAQEKETDSIRVEKLDEVLINAIRANADAPMTHSNRDKADLESRNLGQDLPSLVALLPAVVTTSDAGAGIGYSGIRVRGSDATRVNVTINGIPYNDPESQNTFWVNLGDFTSSVQSLQLQRGVGTSTNGAAAFGASLNIKTDDISEMPYAEFSQSFGSYNSQKSTLKLSTGLLDDHFEVSGRLSKVYSDGYVDRAFTDLKSYFVQAAYRNDRTLIRAIAFGNKEKTYQSWYGVTAEDLKNNRRKNYYTYENETDNYWQDHYQWHWSQTINRYWTSNLSLNYTKGKGYFEQYEEQTDEISSYNGIVLASSLSDEGAPVTDVIRRRWLDNSFYVLNTSFSFKKNRIKVLFGASYNRYTADHFGEVIWTPLFSESASMGDRYYQGDATKIEGAAFAKINYRWTGKWQFFLDLQGRFVNYQTEGLDDRRAPFITDKSFDFFNPKAGISYRFDEQNSFYFSYAKAHREPNRDDFKQGITQAEKLHDLELGWRYRRAKMKIDTNLYGMFYRDQLVLTGAVDDVGSPLKESIGKSYRIGLETEIAIQLNANLSWQANAALSDNKNIDYFIKNDSEERPIKKNSSISFSPNLIAGSMWGYEPMDKLKFFWMSKFVSEQYLNNIEDRNAMLDAYLVNDLSVNYSLEPKRGVKKMNFKLLINNVLDEKYESNGADYGGGYVYYYPQAGVHFLAGATIFF